MHIRYADICAYSFLREVYDIKDGVRKGISGKKEGKKIFTQKFYDQNQSVYFLFLPKSHSYLRIFFAPQV